MMVSMVLLTADNYYVLAFKRIYPQDDINIDNIHTYICVYRILTMHLQQNFTVHEGSNYPIHDKLVLFIPCNDRLFQINV